MKVAVAKRPVEQFETQAPMPDWQLEPDEEAWGLNYMGSEPLVDADGNPIVEPQPADPLAPREDDETQEWLDEVLQRNPENRPPPAQQRVPPPVQPRVPPPREPSQPEPDPLQPRP
jgi:penicillin-binding protein 1A